MFPFRIWFTENLQSCDQKSAEWGKVFFLYIYFNSNSHQLPVSEVTFLPPSLNVYISAHAVCIDYNSSLVLTIFFLTSPRLPHSHHSQFTNPHCDSESGGVQLFKCYTFFICMSFYTEGSVLQLHTNGGSVNTLQKTVFFFLTYSLFLLLRLISLHLYLLFWDVWVLSSGRPETAARLVSFLFLFSWMDYIEKKCLKSSRQKWCCGEESPNGSSVWTWPAKTLQTNKHIVCIGNLATTERHSDWLCRLNLKSVICTQGQWLVSHWPLEQWDQYLAAANALELSKVTSAGFSAFAAMLTHENCSVMWHARPSALNGLKEYIFPECSLVDWPRFPLATQMAPSTNTASKRNITCVFFLYLLSFTRGFLSPLTQMCKSVQRQNVTIMLRHY